jgi:phytoene dehydrogenase-like protein
MARIVVVGAGMGAMAAAARLATAGNAVTVAERAGHHGGAVGQLRREGLAFDTGPGLLHFPAVWRDLFLKTGKQPLEECVELRRVDPAAEHRFTDGTVLRLPGFSHAGVGQALDAAFGAGAGERWRTLLGRARQTWEATRRPLLEEPLTADAAAAARRQDPYPAARHGLLGGRLTARRPPTLAAVARRELAEPRLAALLTAPVRDYGLDPATAPASATLLAYLEQTFGTWYPRGGMRALADAVYERCLARGVEFRFGTEAVRMLQRDGRAAGVELADGTRLPADSVVWGAAHGERVRADGWSRCTLLLALRGARPADTAHRTLLHPPEGVAAGPLTAPVVTVLRPGDDALCPLPDRETAVLSAPVPAQGAAGAPDWTDPAVGAAFAERLLDAAERAGLGLRGRLLWSVRRTPADVERDTGVPGGTVPPPVLAGAGGALLAPPNAGRLPGAYRVGGLAHPGGGLVHAGMSGTLAAGLITEGPAWRGSY